MTQSNNSSGSTADVSQRLAEIADELSAVFNEFESSCSNTALRETGAQSKANDSIFDRTARRRMRLINDLRRLALELRDSRVSKRKADER